jgi:hypothetical protein
MQHTNRNGKKRVNDFLTDSLVEILCDRNTKNKTGSLINSRSEKYSVILNCKIVKITEMIKNKTFVLFLSARLNLSGRLWKVRKG